MTRTFTEDANAIVVQAYEHAIRLGHPYLGGEHLLLALAAAGQPARGRARARRLARAGRGGDRPPVRRRPVR